MIDKTNYNLNIYWKSGKHNKADYLSKHHPVAHHSNVRRYYIYDPDNPKPYFSTDVNYFQAVEDNDDATNATELETDIKSDDETVHHSNCALSNSFTVAGEGVLISLGRFPVTNESRMPSIVPAPVSKY